MTIFLTSLVRNHRVTMMKNIPEQTNPRVVYNADGEIDFSKTPQECLVIGEDGIGDLPVVKGLNYDEKVPTLDDIFAALATSGLQGTLLAQAVEEIMKMLKWRLSDEPVTEETPEEYRDAEFRKNTKTFIWLSYTSNLMSSGLRETFRFLAKHKLVDAICTTAGGVEEDFMKCLTPFGINEWEVNDREYRMRGLNRTANMVVPNGNYTAFEDWIDPLIGEAVKIQKEEQAKDERWNWTPSTFIDYLGKKIDNEDSVYYWCHKNGIPVFCPSITDGAIGDNLYFASYKYGKLVMDVTEDIRRISNQACQIYPRKSGVVILGGGVPKHHILNANLMRNGADFAVYINTGLAYDGSDAGASTGEALTWGKLRLACRPVKVFGEASMLFPFVCAQSFAKYYHEVLKNQQ